MNGSKIICLAWGILILMAGFAGWRQHFLDGARISQRFGRKFAVGMLIALTVALAVVQTVFAQEDYLKESIGATMIACLFGGIAYVAFDIIGQRHREQLQLVLDDQASQRLSENLKRQERLQDSRPQSISALSEEGVLERAGLFLTEKQRQEEAASLAALRLVPQCPVIAKKPGDCPENYVDLLPQRRWPLIGQRQFQPRVGELKPCMPWQH